MPINQFVDKYEANFKEPWNPRPEWKLSKYYILVSHCVSSVYNDSVSCLSVLSKYYSIPVPDTFIYPDKRCFRNKCDYLKTFNDCELQPKDGEKLFKSALKVDFNVSAKILIILETNFYILLGYFQYCIAMFLRFLLRKTKNQKHFVQKITVENNITIFYLGSPEKIVNIHSL